MAVDDPDDVPPAGRDALDEVDLRLARRGPVARRVLVAALVAAGVRLGAERRVEDDDVADLRIAEAVADPVDEHALADRECRDHRLARDAVRLDEERLDAERERERHGDDDDELDERAARRLLVGRLLLGLHASSPAAADAGPAGGPPPRFGGGRFLPGLPASPRAGPAAGAGVSPPLSGVDWGACSAAGSAAPPAAARGWGAVSAAPPASTTSVAVSP